VKYLHGINFLHLTGAEKTRI